MRGRRRGAPGAHCGERAPLRARAGALPRRVALHGRVDRLRALACARARGRAREGARPTSRRPPKVLPSYAHAVVHLAALEPPDRALALPRRPRRRSDDPDVLAGRGGRAAPRGADRGGRGDGGPRAAPLRRGARRACRSRIADHAASFYLGAGRDPARALRARAGRTSDNRPTDEAVELWLTAAQAAGARDDACAAAAAALGAAPRERGAAASARRRRREGCP